MSLEGSGPAIGRPPRRRATESNGILPAFNGARAPATPARQNWLRRRESNAPKPGYEPSRTPGLTASLVAVEGYDPSRSRQSARSRALIRRTRSPEPTARILERSGGHRTPHPGVGNAALYL